MALQDVWRSMDSQCYQECLRALKLNNLPSLPIAGSTATVCLIWDEDVYILNCGDSSAYSIMSNGETQLLTEEHGTNNISEVQRCVQAGGSLRKQYVQRLSPYPLCCISRLVEAGKDRVYPGGLLVTRFKAI